MELPLKPLLDLSISGIAAFINHDDRKVYLFHSTSIIESLSHNVRSIDTNTHCCLDLSKDRNKLQLIVCERTPSKLFHMLVRIRYWRDLYVSQGYALYRPINGVKFKIRVEYDVRSNVIVKAVNTRNRGYIIGVFRNLGLAHQWVNNTFKDRNYIIPQYSTNSLTKSYLKRYRIQRFE